VEELTYSERVRVSWLLFWRGVGGFFALLYAITFLLLLTEPEILRATPSPWATLLPLIVAIPIALFGLMPLIVRGLVRKPFSGFRLQVTREPWSCPPDRPGI
jgi:hypothetical protein